MFVIWGWRAFLAVLGTGAFFCPQCQADSTYRHVEPRRWFTLFFVPVVPLNRLEPHVVCDRCGGTFLTRVLDAPTAAQFEHAVGLATRAAVAHVVSHVSASPAVVADALAVLTRSAGVHPGYDETMLRGDVATFADPAAAHTYVAPLAWGMSIDGREDLVRRLVALTTRWGAGSAAATVGPVEAIAAQLQLSPAHLAGIRGQVASGVQAGGTQ